MDKHLFGATSSPIYSNFFLKKAAEMYQAEFDQWQSRKLKETCMLKDEAIKLSPHLRELLAKGDFRLTKWLSNDRKVLAEIPEAERASSVINLNIDDLPTECALGLKWNVEAEKFVLELTAKVKCLVQAKLSTRRGILSVVSSLFELHSSVHTEGKAVTARAHPEESGLE